MKKGSPIKGINDIAGKRIAAQQGSTNAKIIREKYPQAQLREFPDQPAAFQALRPGPGGRLHQRRHPARRASRPRRRSRPSGTIVGDFYSEEPYGMAMRKGDAKFKAASSTPASRTGIESGKYFEIYDKWFGPKGELPYPMTPQVKAYSHEADRQVPAGEGRGVSGELHVQVEVLWSGQSGQWLLQGLITTLELSALAWLLAVALGILSGALRTVPFRPAARGGHLLRRVLPQRPAAGLDVLLVLRRAAAAAARRPGLALQPRRWSSGPAIVRARRLSRRAHVGGHPLRHPVHPAHAVRGVAWRSGLTTFQAYRLVILPVALRLIVPPGTNESLNLLKNSSVALTISVAELTFQTRQIETYTAKAIEALTAGTLIYLVLCVSIATIMARVERRTTRFPGLIVAGGSGG